MESGPFHLPEPVPLGAVLVGPATWFDAEILESRQGVHFENTGEALAWLEALCGEPSGDREPSVDVSRLIFLHQGIFIGPTGADRLVDWLEDLTAMRGPFLPILLHQDSPPVDLIRFFRAGLFDAMTWPVDRSAWVNMLVRAEKRFARRQQSRLLLEETSQAQVLLRDFQRQIGGQANRNAGELLQAHETLEAANQELTDAMAELSLLYKFGRELSLAANWDGVLRDILKTLADFVQAGGAALILRSAPGGSFSPRKTWHWDETAWDKVLVNLHDQVDDAVAESIMGPGVFRVDPDLPEEQGGSGKRIIALPLEFQDVRLGYLLLLFATPENRNRISRKYLPFLQTVQVVLSEEVASAQMLDRIRDIGAFNSQVLETVSSAIWVVNDTGHTVFCNRAGQTMLTGEDSSIEAPDEFIFQIGRGRHQNNVQHYEELPELFLDARLHLDDADGLLLPLLRRESAEGFRGEGRIMRSDGQGIPVLIQTSLMPGRNRDESWLVIVAEDLRETRKLEAERLRSEQLEGLVEMSATLAHEIRNPLMGLSAQAELLADQLPPNDPRSRYIHVITGEVERINNTITRMLNFVRPYEPVLDQVNLGDLCRDVLVLVRSKAEEKDVSIEFTAGQESDSPLAWDASLDGGQIKQVLLNLLINAIDAVGPGGRVGLVLKISGQIGIEDKSRGTRLEAPGLALEIRDDGPGIAEGDLARIFRPFFTTKNTGTGLGLSICQKIIAAHRGEIRAVRENDHTVFRVLLPRFQSESEALNHQQEEA